MGEKKEFLNLSTADSIYTDIKAGVKKHRSGFRLIDIEAWIILLTLLAIVLWFVISAGLLYKIMLLFLLFFLSLFSIPILLLFMWDELPLFHKFRVTTPAFGKRVFNAELWGHYGDISVHPDRLILNFKIEHKPKGKIRERFPVELPLIDIKEVELLSKSMVERFRKRYKSRYTNTIEIKMLDYPRYRISLSRRDFLELKELSKNCVSIREK